MLEVNAEKMNCMFMCHHPSAGQTHFMKVLNKSVENVVKLRYLGRTATNQGCIHEEF
jgi:hypothetical protein